MKLLIDIPILLYSSKTLLQHAAMSITTCSKQAESASLCNIRQKQEQKTFRQRALGSSSRVDAPRQLEDMKTTLENGKCFVMKVVLTLVQHL